jgi:redox-sensing transcriptional repressor
MNFAPAQLSVPPNVALKNVNMAMELEGLAYALTNTG